MHIRGFFLWNEKKLVRKHWQHFCASHGIISCISSLISFHSCQFVWYYVFCNRSPFFFCLDKEVPCQNAIQERYVHKHTVKAVAMVTVNKYLPATCPQVADYLSTNYIFRLSFSNFYLLFFQAPQRCFTKKLLASQIMVQFAEFKFWRSKT